ncbi:hypothetical protein DFP72DRAFT_1170471 [Ephemerocybe angulata]|uniref:RNA polymerase II subunit A C-terminal domain phosphatase n=1 Tax=Ephemerocybe angulata TaxID=980116 RepID=A0A8H6HW72_9AGAR|nr:hypothetical protein DFP72DRAFT_1170471 [Tulosesus angulatus]
MADSTDLFLPSSFPYPITVVSLDAPLNSKVNRGSRLLSYSFVYKSKDPDTKPATRFGTWDSTIEGDLSRWSIKVGDVIPVARAKQQPVVSIVEPCKHGIQLGGLCALCGKDLTIIDYTGFSDASRASIQMTHSAFGPTVSLEEAQRIERETADHLLSSRKLSLIVDLDQTIVHATVDPTVGEWIEEGEAWEERQARKQNKSSTPADSDDSDEESEDEDEECNPNWEAIKDVKKFRLGPESFASPSSRQKGKHKMVEADGCMYYIKPRPGWKEFLEEASTKYEMHVYTMGTRAYAEQVCAIIDPDKKIFGNRLLSRDESGSLTQKSLQRLFPCDTSMVVIIDDRADVWEWSPNLVKVIPYDFFVGIGDINSTFLPKLDPSTVTAAPPPPAAEVKLPAAAPDGALASPTNSSDASPPSPGVGDANATGTSAENVLMVANNAALDAQLEERPLAKKEKELQEHEEEDAKSTPSPAPSPSPASPPTPEDKLEHPHRKALLKNDDTELQRVGKLLDEVHSRYFAAHSTRTGGSDRNKGISSNKAADVTRIIPRIRAETLEGCHILFSGLIPLDMRPETAEIWRSATMFGAKCYTDLTHEITHVVAAKRGTVKVDQARKRGNISIVSQLWLTESIAQWRRMDEKPYLLEDPAPASAIPSAAAAHMNEPSSEDEEDWEEAAPHNPGDLELSEIDWSAVNDEVDAAMEESDDEDSTYIGGGTGDDARSERSEQDDESVRSISAGNSPSPSNKRKRLRSVTPSDAGDAEFLRSPLSKRKKMTAERSGLSRLKEEITASSDKGSQNGSAPGSPSAMVEEYTKGDDEDEEDEDEDEEESDGGDLDDFLARELEEEEEEMG